MMLNHVLTVEDKILEYTEEYIYLEQIIKCKKANEVAEIERRIGQAWASFNRQKQILSNRIIPLRLRKIVYGQCILPVLSYAAQTWTLHKGIMEAIRMTQRAMENFRLKNHG